MSYIEKDLLDGEHILYSGKLHWIVFVPAIFWTIAAVAMYVVLRQYNMYPVNLVLGGMAAVYACVLFLKALVVRISTELAVTNKRIIYKTGLISRHTMELPHSRIESIREDQGILGRIFNCGSLVIEGTGGGKEYLSNIDAPLVFKKQAQMAADQAK